MTVRNRTILFFCVLALALAALVPTFFRDQNTDSIVSKWPISKPIVLGLDLAGGVHLVYTVKTKEAVTGHLQVVGNNLKNDLRKDKIAVMRSKLSSDGKLEVVLLNDAVAERAKTKIAEDYKDLQFVEKKIDGDRTVLLYSLPETRALQIENQSVEQAVETLRSRVDQFGVAEPQIHRIGTNRIQLQMPGYSDIEKVKQVVGKTAKLEFRLIPLAESENTITVKDRSGTPVKVEEQVMMSGDAVKTASVSIHSGQVEVLLTLSSDGARLFRQITSENIGRQLAIILDGVLYSAPNIREAIPNGQASISGGFTPEEANQLRIILQAGALPAPLEVAEERTVGPSLGRESIQSGMVAILGGFIAIMLFMVVYYRKSGAVAAGTLGFNLLLMVALLSLFGATLTLPGLAGLALSIGMAVDSNVIIFERIRDELRVGGTRDNAIVQGFDKAFSAILDTNLTILVTALILYSFGTGPIRGFAVTLALGVITTLFCAVFVQRLAFDSLKLTGSKGLSI